MPRLFGAVSVFAISLCLCGCFLFEEDGAWYDKICDRVVDECDAMSATECKQFFGPQVISDDCETAIMQAACADISLESASYDSVCWESCTDTPNQCVGNTIVLCYEGKKVVAECDAMCEVVGKKYLDTCGTTGPDGSVREEELCWCGSK